MSSITLQSVAFTMLEVAWLMILEVVGWSKGLSKGTDEDPHQQGKSADAD